MPKEEKNEPVRATMVVFPRMNLCSLSVVEDIPDSLHTVSGPDDV